MAEMRGKAPVICLGISLVPRTELLQLMLYHRYA